MRYVSTAYLANQSRRNADSKPLFEVAPLFAPLWCFWVMKIKLYQRNGADANEEWLRTAVLSHSSCFLLEKRLVYWLFII